MPRNFVLTFASVGLLIKEKKHKIDFQDCGHLEYPIKMILAIFDLQVASILPTKFKSIGLSVQEMKHKIDFQDVGHGSHLGFRIGRI